MFRFAHPLYLYLLLLIPLFALLYVVVCKRQSRRLKQFGQPDLLNALMPAVSAKRRHLKFCLIMLMLALAVFIMARPQYGTRKEEYTHRGIEAMIAVDVSNSMLCTDVSPSRLDKAKMLVSKLIEQLDDDRMGLVAFAGNALTILPITSDNVSAKMFLEQLSPRTIAVQGTNIGDAIRCAMHSFSDNVAVGKALVLITDAEDHEQGALDAAKQAAKQGIRIFVLSVGTPEGGIIPMQGGGYKKDAQGNVVTTRLNEQVGKEIAAAGDGVYIQVGQSDQAQQLLLAEIDTMQKAEFSAEMFSEYDEQFPAIAIILLIVIAIEVCITEKKNPLLRHIKIFK